MPAAADESSGDIYELKVALMGTDPEIWRRLLVPSSMTLWRFHRVIQVAMGWRNAHMHHFQAGKFVYGDPDEDNDPYEMTRRQDEHKARLREMLRRVGSEAFYIYDFGDNWEHRIVLERRLRREKYRAYPECIDGVLAAPPEDSGGLPGFYDLLRALRDPEDKRHLEILERVGAGYDPERFSLEEINRQLRGRRRITS